LNEQGVNIEEFFYDLMPIQRLWLEEFGTASTLGIRNKRSQVLTNQIKYGGFNAVVFQGAPPPFTSEGWMHVRKKNTELELVIAHLGHTFNPDSLSGVDLILCASDELTHYYRSYGLRAETYLHSFPNHLFTHATDFQVREFEFAFVGSSGFKLQSHQKRLAYLQHLSRDFQIELFLDNQDNIVLPPSISFSNGGTYEFRLRASELRSKIFEKLGFYDRKKLLSQKADIPHKLFESLRDAVYGLEMFKILGNTKLTVQIHTSATSSAGAMRIFESAGVGTCLISDGVNMGKILVPDSEVVMFESEDELHRKCKYLLTHQDEMRQIAENGQKAVLKRHSTQVRAKEFLEITGLRR